MRKKVYDPIHDVFQNQAESDEDSKAAMNDQASASGRAEIAEDDDDMNTESEEDHGSPIKGFPVPSVTTSRKKMKESSKYNRHLKKPDGEFFSRKDLQFHFLRRLLLDDRPLFTNIFKEIYAKSMAPLASVGRNAARVSDKAYDARAFVFNDKLTFSQHYILTLASSTKCSKVLRDKLLLDHQVAFSTCILALLVNIGRLNTTINFYLEMTSQLRTFHSVPCLQYKVADLKSLQDTPRLKSILKNLPIGNEQIDLSEFYETPSGGSHRLNLVNLLFTLCDSVSLVNLKLLSKYVCANGKTVSLFNILDSPGYEPEDRCNVLLWLLYIHTETDLTDDAIQRSIKIFTQDDKLPLRPTDEDYDKDSQDEIDFGMQQKAKRKEFLKRIKHHDAEDRETQEQEEEAKEEENEQEEDTLKEELDETLQETDSLEEEIPVPATPQRKRRDVTKDKKELKRRKIEHAISATVKSEPQNNEADRIEYLIETDKNKIVGKLGRSDRKTGEQFIRDLLESQGPVRWKRRDLGLLKIFNEYEDIPMASVIGIRGKKRKKFKDNVLGFETDFLRNFAAAKKIMLQHQDSDDDLRDAFHL
ncbi:hypothetical protein HG536_0B06370 [Torulaspora globosa]|uniref:Ino eighty subunit 1 n=1 Tax=Torulaspora globosa TaxID=48254 RepID=A0A7G3ZE33_9SACH|nr:uncharacterized protein HG536_0B06370 [Torulaspora globosa]QLL31769.1 hypothetical protein HG536_0B06370 [Torulaspora globosa]